MIRSWIVLAGVLAVSCGNNTATLLEAGEDMDARQEERARRMAITIVNADGTEASLSASEVTGYLEGLCMSEFTSAWDVFSKESIDEACFQALSEQLYRADCVAQHLLEASEREVPQEQGFSYTFSTGGETHTLDIGWTLPPQLPEARIALAREASEVARNAVVAAGDTIREASRTGSPSSGTNVARISECDTENLTTSFSYTQGDETIQATPLGLIAEVLTATTATMERAVSVEGRFQQAVAEAERSRSTSPSTVATLGWVDPTMSRGAFVKHLFGGTSAGLYGYTDGEGVCAIQEPDGGTREAIDFLRSMAVDPREVLNTDIELDALVLGGAGVTTSLSARQAELTGDAPLSTTDSVLAAAGVTESSVSRARQYLREEARAFATLPVQMADGIPLSPEVDNMGGMSERSADAWAGLARTPSAPPPMYYIGAAWQPEIADVQDLGDYTTAVTSAYADTSIAATLDYAISLATDLAELETTTSGYAPLPTDARVRLRPLVETAAVRVPARVHFSRYIGSGGGDGSIYIYVHGRDPSYTTASRIRIVQGVSGLRCAVDGNVQGEPCELSDYILTPTYETSNTTSNRTTGFSEYALVGISYPSVGSPPANALPQESADEDFIYVLRPTSDDDDVPGVYEAIAAHRLGKAGNYDVKLPVVPEYTEIAGDMLRSSGSFCGTTKANCAAPAFADRIPLENEITGDDGGHGLENSWQYWLGLAEESANLADRIGEEMLTSGEVLDEGIEAVEDSLSELCGGPVNFRDAYFETLSEAPPGPPPCVGDFVEVGGNCVRDINHLLEDPRFETLRSCLAEESVVDYVAAGTRPLCAWTYEGRLCGTPDEDDAAFEMDPVTGAGRAYQPCPWVVYETEVDCQAPPTSIPMTATLLESPITRTLDIFETDDPGGLQDPPPPPGPFDCRTLRDLRDTQNPAVRRQLAQSVISSPDFSLENVREWAQGRIGFRSYPDDYAEITLDNKGWRGTGLPWDGGVAVQGWPCRLDPDRQCPSGGTNTLFCATANDHCESDVEEERVHRAFMNSRMARAVLALKVLTLSDAANVEVPFRPSPILLTTEADTERSSNGYNELAHWRWTLRSLSDDQLARHGRSFAIGDGMNYDVWEHDTASDQGASLEIEGRSYCLATTGDDGWIWTHFNGSSPADWVKVFAPCAHNGSRFRGGGASSNPDEYVSAAEYPLSERRTQGVVFGSLGAIAEVAPGNEGFFRDFWRGVGSDPSLPVSGPRVCGDGPRAECDSFADGLKRILRGEWSGRVLEAPTCEWSNSGYVCRYDRAARYSSYWMSGKNESNRYNDIRLMEDGITTRDVLDGLELLCEMRRDDFANQPVFEPSTCGDWNAMVEGGISNLRQAEKLMLCLAHEIHARGEVVTFSDVPEAALDAVRSGERVPGTRGAEIHGVVQNLQELAAMPRRMESQLRDVGLLMRQARLALGRAETRQELNEVERRSTQLREATTCISAALNAAARATTTGFSDPKGGAATALYVAAAAATCANSIGQIVIAKQRESLQNEIANIDSDSELANIEMRMGAALDSLQEVSLSASQAQQSLLGALSKLEAQRETAMNSVNDALTTYGNTSAVSTLRRRRFNTREARYQEAQERAIRTSWLARRALEQRIGRDLSTMDDDMPLVDAPSQWADELCTMGGMDYQAITRDYQLPGGDSYAREYVGDYVRRLRGVFDSYSVAHPFVTGDDTAVVSLRDDVVHARQRCETPVRNLLAFSGELNVATDPDYVAPPPEPDGVSVLDRSGPSIWEQVGCAPYPVTVDDGEGGTETIDRVAGCIGFTRLDSEEEAPLQSSPEFGSPNGWLVSFGGRAPYTGAQSSYTSGARVAQAVELEPGSYRLSWRGREVTMGFDPKDAVTVLDENGVELSSIHRVPTAYPDGGWDLYYLFFSLSETQNVEVSVSDTSSAASTTSVAEVELATFMLEDVTGEIGTSTSALTMSSSPNPPDHPYPPMPYIQTRQAGRASLAVCEDTDGTVFRNRWVRDCTRLCPGGGASCTEGRRACYWELPFSISQTDLEYGGQLANAGFANGNYNYRWNTMAANVVGVAVRDCDGSTSPSSCYGAGYVPYSLYQDGGFDVRNHWGELYEAPLHPGRLEHARALNAERFITNPLSSADRALVEPYSRYEMRGRPLAGRYRIRIWDEPGIRFDRIEDVQVVMSYRYWTRLD